MERGGLVLMAHIVFRGDQYFAAFFFSSAPREAAGFFMSVYGTAYGADVSLCYSASKSS